MIDGTGPDPKEQHMAPDEHDENEQTAGDSDDVVVEELLVEDVSIDGMCGVY